MNLFIDLGEKQIKYLLFIDNNCIYSYINNTVGINNELIENFEELKNLLHIDILKIEIEKNIIIQNIYISSSLTSLFTFKTYKKHLSINNIIQSEDINLLSDPENITNIINKKFILNNKLNVLNPVGLYTNNLEIQYSYITMSNVLLNNFNLIFYDINKNLKSFIFNYFNNDNKYECYVDIGYNNTRVMYNNEFYTYKGIKYLKDILKNKFNTSEICLSIFKCKNNLIVQTCLDFFITLFNEIISNFMLPITFILYGFFIPFLKENLEQYYENNIDNIKFKFNYFNNNININNNILYFTNCFLHYKNLKI